MVRRGVLLGALVLFGLPEWLRGKDRRQKKRKRSKRKPQRSRPGDLVARGAVWRPSVIPVWDHTPAAVQPAIGAAVALVNDLRPSNMPRLDYRPVGEEPCTDLPRHGRVGGISVCAFSQAGGLMGRTDYRQNQHAITQARVKINTVYSAVITNTVCHELFHATTLAPESVVPSGAVCEFNAGYARRVYAKYQHLRH